MDCRDFGPDSAAETLTLKGTASHDPDQECQPIKRLEISVHNKQPSGPPSMAPNSLAQRAGTEAPHLWTITLSGPDVTGTSRLI